MKSYTDLFQSKKLAEILPLETADMYYSDVPVREWIDRTDISKGTHVIFKSEIFAIENLRNHEIGEGDIYAWSLAALRYLLPTAIKPNKDTYLFESHNTFDNSWVYRYYNEDDYSYLYCKNINEVDACYEMIIKLNELKML